MHKILEELLEADVPGCEDLMEGGGSSDELRIRPTESVGGYSDKG
jgi:hypothetical protein